MARILIVEDTSIMRYTIKTILEDLDHEVVAQANNGYDAIEKYRMFKPDIVTMDITMPSKNGIENGIEALVKIREINKDANVIMLTSHGETTFVMKAVTKGAKGYILKPITKDKVKESFSKLNLE